MRTFDPSQHEHSEIYKLMIGAIIPRPIAVVSSIDAAGVRNLAPFSYFTACSSNPPVVCFCTAVRTGTRPHKDTLENIKATGEFVVNIVSEEIAGQMNRTSADVPPEVEPLVGAIEVTVGTEVVAAALVVKLSTAPGDQTPFTSVHAA